MNNKKMLYIFLGVIDGFIILQIIDSFRGELNPWTLVFVLLVIVLMLTLVGAVVISIIDDFSLWLFEGGVRKIGPLYFKPFRINPLGIIAQRIIFEERNVFGRNINKVRDQFVLITVFSLTTICVYLSNVLNLLAVLLFPIGLVNALVIINVIRNSAFSDKEQFTFHSLIQFRTKEIRDSELEALNHYLESNIEDRSGTYFEILNAAYCMFPDQFENIILRRIGHMTDQYNDTSESLDYIAESEQMLLIFLIHNRIKDYSDLASSYYSALLRRSPIENLYIGKNRNKMFVENQDISVVARKMLSKRYKSRIVER